MGEGMSVGITLWEHDSGDRDKHLDLVKKGVAAGGLVVTAGCGALGGPAAAAVCAGLWAAASEAMVGAFNDLIGSADDWIATSSVVFSAKDMVRLARAPRLHFWGIDYHLESNLLSDGECSYKVYFEITTV
jgi:hypothetical protein